MAIAPACSLTRSLSVASPGASTTIVVRVDTVKFDGSSVRPAASPAAASRDHAASTPSTVGGTDVISPSP